MTTWYVFHYSDPKSTSRHLSYAQAVLEAQSRGCTESRPRRLYAGLYQIVGCGSHVYFIATAETMQREHSEHLKFAMSEFDTAFAKE